MIFSSNSIYYHLLNLDSVDKSTDSSKMFYKYINIVLEEIELYFHPDYQRMFINRLLEGIKKLNLQSIKGINIIFITHSPFILSDIPNSNIMYLSINNEGKSICLKDNKKSFASNIHHLLGDNFFFDHNIYIGEFAHKKIKDIIKFIKIGNKKDIEYYFKLIKQIDEPILKNKLIEMLFEKFPESQRQNITEQREIMIKEYAKQMGIEIEIKRN